MINSESYAGLRLNVTYVRNGEEHNTTIMPMFDGRINVFKLGLWIRDDAAGVGTLTYIRKDNLRFGALGHPVCDIDTGSLLPVLSGNIYKCNIVGYKQGKKGNPGELKGLFLRNGSVYGSLDGNNKFGVYEMISVILYFFCWLLYYFGVVNSVVIIGICLFPCLSFLFYEIKTKLLHM